jgi:hypothetical protein
MTPGFAGDGRRAAARGLAGVVGDLVRLPLMPSRRLQLAAEASGVVAFALRRSGMVGHCSISLRIILNQRVCRTQIPALRSSAPGKSARCQSGPRENYAAPHRHIVRMKQATGPRPPMVTFGSNHGLAGDHVAAGPQAQAHRNETGRARPGLAWGIEGPPPRRPPIGSSGSEPVTQPTTSIQRKRSYVGYRASCTGSGC